MRRAAFVLAALALGGCETTAEKSAKLEAAAKSSGATGVGAGAREAGLRITHPSTVARVLDASVVHSAEGTAAVVRVANASARPLRDVPIQITVRDAHGAAVYSNTAPGLGRALVSLAAIPAHGSATWVDDQIRAAGVPASLSAVVGDSPPLAGAPARLHVSGAHLTGEGAGGSVRNVSAVAEREVVVYAVARRGRRVVAAGRAVLPEVPAHSSTPFQLYFIGDPSGAHLETGAAPTAIG